MICCSTSCAASFSLLCFLSYQAIKTKFSRDRGQTVIQNSTPQGYFWLVQLFIAGILQPVNQKTYGFRLYSKF